MKVTEGYSEKFEKRQSTRIVSWLHHVPIEIKKLTKSDGEADDRTLEVNQLQRRQLKRR